MKKVKISEQSTDTLKGTLASLEAGYNTASIEFKNANGQIVVCPANLIDRLGKYAGPTEDKASLDLYLKVYFRATHESRTGAKGGCECRLSAGESIRNGVRVTSTVKGLDPKKAKVSHQYAVAQKWARDIHAIRTELAARANAEKVAAEAAAAAALEAANREYLGMPAVTVAAAA